MNPTARALRDLIVAIDDNAESRVLLDKREGERRTEHVVMLRAIAPAYRRARNALDTGRRRDR